MACPSVWKKAVLGRVMQLFLGLHLSIISSPAPSATLIVRQYVTWTAGTQNVRLASNGRLHNASGSADTSSAGSSSLRLSSNFTSRSWTICPFTNRTCSSQVEPYSKIAACTGILDEPLLSDRALSPADSALLQYSVGRNDTAVLSLKNDKSVTVNSSLAQISTLLSSGRLSIVTWIWLSSATGSGNLRVVAKTATSDGKAVYSLKINGGQQMYLEYGSGLRAIILLPGGGIDLRRPAWHHVVVVINEPNAPVAYLDGTVLDNRLRIFTVSSQCVSKHWHQVSAFMSVTSNDKLALMWLAVHVLLSVQDLCRTHCHNHKQW